MCVVPRRHHTIYTVYLLWGFDLIGCWCVSRGFSRRCWQSIGRCYREPRPAFPECTQAIILCASSGLKLAEEVRWKRVNHVLPAAEAVAHAQPTMYTWVRLCDTNPRPVWVVPSLARIPKGYARRSPMLQSFSTWPGTVTMSLIHSSRPRCGVYIPCIRVVGVLSCKSSFV